MPRANLTKTLNMKLDELHLQCKFKFNLQKMTGERWLQPTGDPRVTKKIKTYKQKTNENRITTLQSLLEFDWPCARQNTAQLVNIPSGTT